MASYKTLFFLTSFFLIKAHAGLQLDKKDKINGIVLQTGKNDANRIYQGSVSRSFSHSLPTVIGGILNFTEKCNNSYKDERKFTNKQADCKYHNDHLIESFIVKDIKQNSWTKDPHEIDRFLLGRRIYNRGHFAFYELVQVFEEKNTNNQKTVKIIQRMLNDQEVLAYTKPLLKKDSAFNRTSGTFVLTQVSPQETQFHYEYKAETDHWILNKEVSVPQVFTSISKSINDLIKTVDSESLNLSRDLASNK
jgi:hypothetical protein